MQDSLEAIVEMKEHDVPYHIRFCIDEGVRCGHWFNVSAKVGYNLLSCLYASFAVTGCPWPLVCTIYWATAPCNLQMLNFT